MESDPDLLTRWRDRLLSESVRVIRESAPDSPPRFIDAMLAAAEAARPAETALLACGTSRWSGGDFETGLPAAVAAHLLRAALVAHLGLPGFDSSFSAGTHSLCGDFDQAATILAGDALIPLAVSHLIAEGGRHGAALVDDAMEAIGSNGVIGGISLEQEGRATALTGDTPSRELRAGHIERFAAASGARLAGASERQADQASLLGLETGRAWSMISDCKSGQSEGGRRQELLLEAESIFDDARILAGSSEAGGLLREIIGYLRNLSPGDPSDLFS